MVATPQGWPSNKSEAAEYYRRWDDWARFRRPPDKRFRLDDLLRDFMDAARHGAEHRTLTYSDLYARYKLRTHGRYGAAGAVAGVIGELSWANWGLHLSALLVSKPSKDGGEGSYGQGFPSGGLFSLNGIDSSVSREDNQINRPLSEADKRFAERAQETAWAFFSGMTTAEYNRLTQGSFGVLFEPPARAGKPGQVSPSGHLRHVGESDVFVEESHKRLSKAFCYFLEGVNAFEKPRWEVAYHDVEWRYQGEEYLFELKALPGKRSDEARWSIREAIGQLLDYEHYPGKGRRFSHRAIVLDACPRTDDIRWVYLLREALKWPVELFWFDKGKLHPAPWTTSDLSMATR